MRRPAGSPCLATAVVSLALAGCSGGEATTTEALDDTAGSGDSIRIELPEVPADALEVELSSPEGPTPVGTAFLWAEGEMQTRVVAVLRTRSDTVRPVSLREGTCEQFERHPPFLLEDLEDGVSESLVDLPFAEFAEEPHSVVVTTDPDAPAILACGTVEP